MVIMGFGFGALLMSKLVAPWLLGLAGGNLVAVFAWLGVGFMAATGIVGLFLRDPPPGYAPPGYTAAHAVASGTPSEPKSPGVLRAIAAPTFAMMWLVFFCNILAGISIISFQSPMFQGLWRSLDPELSAAALASYGASLIAVSSVFNGVGRMFWGGISDHIGRVQTFRIMLASQVVAFGLLVVVDNPWIFGGLICYVLLCYGGGFGTMPSFVLDVFGKRLMAVVYGAILTAWSAAGIVGPQLVAFLTDRFPEKASTLSFLSGAAFLTVGLVLSLFLRDGHGDRPSARARE
jgi:OFA family oxalate/formate antiporter-like MFS transporter